MRRNMKRSKVARKFNRQSGKTKRLNIAPPPQRGGYRL